MSTGRQPETVRAYLDALQAALKGAPPALIQDALADAEEHLRNEIAQNPELSESAVLESAIENFGTPEEVAETYRLLEESLTGPFPKSEENRPSRFSFFGIVSDPRAYGALVYMLLSIATGIFYFTWTVTGLSLTVGLFILVIGIPFALLFIGSERVIAHVEGRVVETLLGVRMPRRLPTAYAERRTLFSRIGEALADIRTWSSILYLLLMLPLGVIYFVIAVVGLSLSLGIAAVSMYSLVTNQSHFSMDALPVLDHVLHTAPGLVIFALIGVLLFFVVLHVAKFIGLLHGKLAELLLVRL